MTNNGVTAAADMHYERVEEGLLGSLGQNLDNWHRVESAFRSEDFIKNRDVYLFIQNHVIKYSTLPSNSQISATYNFNPPIGEFRYWLDEFTNYALKRKVQTILLDGMKIQNPKDMMNSILDQLGMLRSQQTNQIKASDASAMDRLAKFDLRTEHVFNSSKIVGLRTGLKVIDDSKEGWTPGSLVGILARPSVGKTWFLQWQGAISWLDGATILSIAPEMPANQLDLRGDAILANLVGKTLDYNKIRRGDPSIRKEYKEVLELLSGSKRWWTYSSTFSSSETGSISLGDIRSLIRQHQPDIVLIDGIFLLRWEGRGQSWEKMENLAYGLKAIATTSEVPILVTHGASNSARGRRTMVSGVAGRGDDDNLPTLNDIAYGDSLGYALSDMISMAPEPTDRNIIWYRIGKHRERGWETLLPDRMGLATDFARGKIYDLSEHGYSPAAVGDAARRLLA